jgi:hypothetical protein
MIGQEITGVVVEVVRETSEQQWKDMDAPERKQRIDVVIHPDDDSVGIRSIILKTDGSAAEGVRLGQRMRLTISEP